MSIMNGNGNGVVKPLKAGERRRLKEAGEWTPIGQEGLWVRVRPVPLHLMIEAGQVPNVLIPVAYSVIYQPDKRRDLASDVKTAKQFVDLCKLVAPLTLLQPRIVENPQGDDEMALEDFNAEELSDLLNVALLPTERLKSFRHQQEAMLGAMANVQGVPPAAEPEGESR